MPEIRSSDACTTVEAEEYSGYMDILALGNKHNRRPAYHSFWKRYALVATNYFTKWIEAEAYNNITQTYVINFICKNVICRFGLPYMITIDNGTQFTKGRMKKFCDHHGIKLSFPSRIYPQENGQAKASNKIIFENLKKKLEEEKGTWAEELSNVL